MTHNLSILVLTPNGGFHVDGLVNGAAMSFLVDIGAAVTLIHKDEWDSLNVQTQRVDLHPWDEHLLVGVNGTPLQVHGHACVDILLVGHFYEADVVVVSSLTTWSRF